METNSEQNQGNLQGDKMTPGMLALYERALEMRMQMFDEKVDLIKQQTLNGEVDKTKAMMIITVKDGIVKIDWRYIKMMYKGRAMTGNIPKKRGVIIYDLKEIKKHVNEWEMGYIEKYETMARLIRYDIREQRKVDRFTEKMKKKNETSEDRPKN